MFSFFKQLGSNHLTGGVWYLTVNEFGRNQFRTLTSYRDPLSCRRDTNESPVTLGKYTAKPCDNWRCGWGQSIYQACNKDANTSRMIAHCFVVFHMDRDFGADAAMQTVPVAHRDVATGRGEGMHPHALIVLPQLPISAWCPHLASKIPEPLLD